MRHASRSRVTLAAGVALAAVLALSTSAEAHGRGGGRAVVVGGFWRMSPWWGISPYWGWGWGPGLYPPAYYQPEGGVSLDAAMMAGFGAIDLNVKPNRADVWVDGKYAGEARDLDGYPSYLWLAEGEHRIAVHKGGYLVFDEPIHVQRGMRTEIKLRLQPGDSPAPGPKPAPGADEKASSGKKKE